ncbi:MAG: hypothetical protein WA982_01870 [Rubrobacteraceae bacterium]
MLTLPKSYGDTFCQSGAPKKQPEESSYQDREKRDGVVPVRRRVLGWILIRRTRLAGLALNLVYRYGWYWLQNQLVHASQRTVTDKQGEHQ